MFCEFFFAVRVKNLSTAHFSGVLRSCAELLKIFVEKLFEKFCVY